MIARYGTSLLSAFLLTALLLFFMQLLIATGRNAVVENASPTRFLDFVRVKEAPTPVTTKAPPDVRKDVAKPPPTRLQSQGDLLDSGPDIAIPLVEPDIPLDAPGLGIGSGELIPIIKVEPIYPSGPLSRGQECDVLVEYDVLTSGATANPRIVNQAVCGGFHRSALASVLKYRYRPRVVDGAPVQVNGVQTVIRYRISK